MKSVAICLVVVACAASAASAQVRITEWQYNGTEFVEFTNLGNAPVDMTGWSFDDDSRLAGTVSLSGIGTLGAGKSAILSELSAADFRTAWSLSPTVPVIGSNTANLGRADEVNLFDATNTLVDRLTYADNATPANGPRTDINSGNPATLALALEGAAGNTNATGWVLSASGDLFGSTQSTLGGFGNPGVFALVPEPTSLAAIAMAGLLIGRRRS